MDNKSNEEEWKSYTCNSEDYRSGIILVAVNWEELWSGVVEKIIVILCFSKNFPEANRKCIFAQNYCKNWIIWFTRRFSVA